MSNFFGKYVQKANGYIFPKKRRTFFVERDWTSLTGKNLRPLKHN